MTTTKTIGSGGGRDYSTIQTWYAAFNLNSITGWTGLTENDTEFKNTASIVLSGNSTTTLNRILLTTDTGQSAFDSTSNALAYNGGATPPSGASPLANGVGVRKTTNYNDTITVEDNYVTINKIQFQAPIGADQVISDNNMTLTASAVSQCLFQINASPGHACVNVRSLPITNCVIIVNASGGDGLNLGYVSGSLSANNTIVRPSDKTAAANGIKANGNARCVNNATFGFSTPINQNGNTFTGSNNATDGASIGFGTGNLTGLTYTSQFVGTVSTAMDFRIKTGAALIDAGNTDTTDIPAANDIFGTSRPQGSAWDIGAHELAASGVSGSGALLEIQDALTATGTVLISGSGALLERQDSLAATGTVLVSGSGALLEIQDALAATGSVASGIAGSGALQEIQDTLAATGTVLVSGTGALLEIQDALAATGTVTLPAVTGSGALLERQDLWNGQGTNGAVQQGGHFLPLSKKELESIRKEARRLQKARESAWAERSKEIDDISREMSEIAHPKPKLSRPILTLPTKPEVDDGEDEELELLLLHS